MARKSIKGEQNFQEVLKGILEKENEMYEKAGIMRTFVVSFPNRQKAPLLGRIGVKLITMAGGLIQIQFNKVDKK